MNSEMCSLSVKSAKSVAQFLQLRLPALFSLRLNPQSAKKTTNRRWTRIDTDGMASRYPRSAAFSRGSNLQSAIRNSPSVPGPTESNPVKPGQTRSCLFPTPAERPGIRAGIPHIAVSFPEYAKDCGLPLRRASRQTGHWQFPHLAQSNPVKPLHPGTQRGVGVLEYWVFPSLHHFITPVRTTPPLHGFQLFSLNFS